MLKNILKLKIFLFFLIKTFSHMISRINYYADFLRELILNNYKKNNNHVKGYTNIECFIIKYKNSNNNNIAFKSNNLLNNY